MEAIQKKLAEDKEYDRYADVIWNHVNAGQILVAMRDDRDRQFANGIF